MSKKMRLRPEPLHAPRATQQHAHPAPPKAPALMPTAAPAGRGLGTVDPLLAPLPPSCCMTSARVRDRIGTCVVWGLVGRAPSSLSPRLGSPRGTHIVGKVGTPGALETPHGSSARPRGRRRETKMAGGGLAYHHCRDLPLGLGRPGSAATHMEGCTLPELESAENAGMESESLMGVPGPHWGRGQYWRI